MTSNMIACAGPGDSQGAALLQSSAFLAGLVDAATDAIIVCDAQLRIVLFNAAAQRMFGLGEAILQQRHGAALAPAASSLIARAIGAVSQMDSLTADLLRYARLGDQAHCMAPVNMRAAAAEACSLLHDAIAQSGAVIHTEALPAVHADPRQMVQLLHNLLGNAIKYCKGRAAPTATRMKR